MSKELLHIMFKSIAEGDTSKATEALSQYLHAKADAIVNEGWTKKYDSETKDYDPREQHPWKEPVETAKRVRNIVRKADEAGIELNDGNIVDLIADNLTDLTLQDIRHALLDAGLGKRFPKVVATVMQAGADPGEYTHYDLGESVNEQAHNSHHSWINDVKERGATDFKRLKPKQHTIVAVTSSGEEVGTWHPHHGGYSHKPVKSDNEHHESVSESEVNLG